MLLDSCLLESSRIHILPGKSPLFPTVVQDLAALTTRRVFAIPTVLGAISTVAFWFMYKDLDKEEFSLVSASELEQKDHAH